MTDKAQDDLRDTLLAYAKKRSVDVGMATAMREMQDEVDHIMLHGVHGPRQMMLREARHAHGMRRFAG